MIPVNLPGPTQTRWNHLTYFWWRGHQPRFDFNRDIHSNANSQVCYWYQTHHAAAAERKIKSDSHSSSHYSLVRVCHWKPLWSLNTFVSQTANQVASEWNLHHHLNFPWKATHFPRSAFLIQEQLSRIWQVSLASNQPGAFISLEVITPLWCPVNSEHVPVFWSVLIRWKQVNEAWSQKLRTLFNCFVH